jgi:hypothetical protein
VIEKTIDETYVIQFELWQASHALMREYATVLHLHKLESSTPLGPVYEYPGMSESMVNATQEQRKIETSQTAKDGERNGTLTSLIACRHQIRRDRTRILINRVECLDEKNLGFST